MTKEVDAGFKSLDKILRDYGYSEAHIRGFANLFLIYLEQYEGTTPLYQVMEKLEKVLEDTKNEL